jgi:hypothetical protein
MLLTLLLDPQGGEAFTQFLKAVLTVFSAVVLWWILRMVVLAGITLLIGRVLFWSINRLVEEARSDAPRDSVIWQGLGGLCLALGLVVASWKGVLMLVAMGW